MSRATLMIIDDHDIMRESLKETLARAGYVVRDFASPTEAMSALARGRCDLVITDMKMPEMDGLDVVSKVNEHDPDLPVVVVTAYGTIETAVEAMKRGAFDYISKPFRADEIELVVQKALKHKRLVGGGTLRIVNDTVPSALKNLGYSDDEVKEMVAYVDEHSTIEGAPHLDEGHLPVFDCAFRALGGERAVHYMGHLKMVAAAQPFISGAISKTINVPENVTVDEISQAYMEAWRLGAKAVAVYRDGSKRTQPLATAGSVSARASAASAGTAAGAATGAAWAAEFTTQPVRRKLADERQSLTHKFSIGGHKGYITVGLFEDGTPGEIFITMAKQGSTISGLMDSFACMTSFALQYHVPLKFLVGKLSHARYEPSGWTGNPELPYAKSITDYVFRWLGLRFLSTEERAEIGMQTEKDLEALEEMEAGETAEDGAKKVAAVTVASRSMDIGAGDPIAFAPQPDAPLCQGCGSLMVRSGVCYKCMNCGATSGCS